MDLKHQILAVLAWAGAFLDMCEAHAEEWTDAILGDYDGVGRAQVGTVLTVVTLGITILVGLLIYGQIESSLPTPSNNQLSNATDNSTETFADAMELAPVIMIILLAAVVLAVVQRFR